MWVGLTIATQVLTIRGVAQASMQDFSLLAGGHAAAAAQERHMYVCAEVVAAGKALADREMQRNFVLYSSSIAVKALLTFSSTSATSLHDCVTSPTANVRCLLSCILLNPEFASSVIVKAFLFS